MLNLEIEAKNWMERNNVEFTNERHISLINLLIDIENEAYNAGIHRWVP